MHAAAEQPWDPPPDSAVTYWIRCKSGVNYQARGMRVGRFAVRSRAVFETKSSLGLPVFAWCVDHINSGLLFYSTDDFGAAVRFADDVSRNARRDVRSKAHERVKNQLGPDVHRWVVERRRGVCVLDFRAWHDQQTQPSAARTST